MTAITSLPFVCPSAGNYELVGDLAVNLQSGRAITPVSGCRINLGPYSIVNTNTDTTNTAEAIGAYPISDVEIVGGGPNMGNGFMFGVNFPPTPAQPIGGGNIVIRDGQWNGVLLRAICAASPNGRAENLTVRNTGGCTSITIPMAFENFGNWIRRNLNVENVWAVNPNEEMVAFAISQATGSRTQSYNENLRCVNDGPAKLNSIAFWSCSDTQQAVDVIDGLESVNFSRVLWLGSDTPPFHPYSFRRGVVGTGYVREHKILSPSKAMLTGAGDLMVPGSAAPPVEGTVVFDPPLNTLSTGNSGYSIRGVSSQISTGGTQVRVTFKSPPEGGVSASHVSIGKQATLYNTVAVPVELKFAGASGFSMSPSGQVTSDWADLNTTAGDVLVTVIDSNSSTQIRTAGAYAGGTHYNLAGTSWNQATPSGFTDWGNQYLGGKIEVK